MKIATYFSIFLRCRAVHDVHHQGVRVVDQTQGRAVRRAQGDDGRRRSPGAVDLEPHLPRLVHPVHPLVEPAQELRPELLAVLPLGLPAAGRVGSARVPVELNGDISETRVGEWIWTVISSQQLIEQLIGMHQYMSVLNVNYTA